LSCCLLDASGRLWPAVKPARSAVAAGMIECRLPLRVTRDGNWRALKTERRANPRSENGGTIAAAVIVSAN
jgi:hypothetical protein